MTTDVHSSITVSGETRNDMRAGNTMFRWHEWLIIAVGVWLLVSPDLLDFSLDRAATANAYALGTALVIFNLTSVARITDEGQDIINLMLSCWLVVSPFLLGFCGEITSAMNAVAAGAAVGAFAFLQILRTISNDQSAIAHQGVL